MRGPVPDGPKIGVLGPPHRPAEQLAGYGQKAGQLGFPEVGVAEDCFLHGAFTQAATILASTTGYGGAINPDNETVTGPQVHNTLDGHRTLKCLALSCGRLPFTHSRQYVV